MVVDGVTLERMREAAAASRARPTLLVVDARQTALRAGEVSFESLVSRQPAELDAARRRADDIAIWKFTTGSTGRPKACVHTARSPLASFEGYARGVLDIRAEDVVLPVPKLFFGYARDLAALFPFGVGASGVIFADRTTPELIYELIARYRPTILVNVPTMMQAMLDHPGAADQDLSCIRLCTSAGEALPEPLHHRWNDTFGVEVLDGIGSSEAYHIYVSNRPGRVRPGSIGEVVPGYAAEVVDDGGRPVPDGQIGRLWIRGESASLMYWGDEQASARTFAGDLVMSGDLVERDPGGYFVLPRPGRRSAQGRRDLGGAGRDRTLPRHPSRCRGMRGGRRRARRPDPRLRVGGPQARGVDHPGRIAGLRASAARAAQGARVRCASSSSCRGPGRGRSIGARCAGLTPAGGAGGRQG